MNGLPMQKLADRVTRVMNIVAGATLTFMMLLTVTDVVLRYLGHPFLGAYETVAFGGAVAIAFAMPRTALGYGNICVEFVVDSIGSRMRRWFSLFTRSLGIVLFFLMGYGLVVKGVELYRGGEVTPGLQIIFYPIAFGLAFCFFIQCLVLSYLMFREFTAMQFGGGDHHGD